MGNGQFEKVYRKENKMFMYLVALACFLSNISQLPLLVSAGMTQKLNMPIWIILLLYIFLKKRIKVFYSTFKILFAMICIFELLFIASIFTKNSYFNSSVLQGLILSIFIYCLGTFVGDKFSDKDLKFISLSYVISASLVALSIYIEFFSAGFDITSRQYAYASKNSISQIIFTAIVILMFIRFEKYRVLNLIKFIVIIFEIMLLMLLKSRATIIGFGICLLYIILGKQFNRKMKYFLIMVIMVGVIALLVNDNLFDMFIGNIMFAGRNASNLDSLTSGRVSIITEFPVLIRNHWLTGIGSLYFECFPLSCILQFGIITGTIILGVSYLPLLKCLQFNRKNIYCSIFILICIGYAINSLFEGLAPIGPGVKCYYMWLMYGILLARNVNGYQ